MKKNSIYLVILLVSCLFCNGCKDSDNSDGNIYEPEPSVQFPEAFPSKYGDKPILIAHGGGGIDGNTYTNSLEALANSLSIGYNFIELDLIILKDSVIAGGHDMKHLNLITGEGEVDIPITSEELKNRKIYGLYTPLLYNDIVKLFQNSQSYLVTDKIENEKLLEKQISLDKSKMLIETFSYNSYLRFLNKGYKYPMLCIWNEEQLDKNMDLFSSLKVRIITIPIGLINSRKQELESLLKNGIAVFAFSSNDKNFILEHGGKTVTGFYTDFITNEDLNK